MTIFLHARHTLIRKQTFDSATVNGHLTLPFLQLAAWLSLLQMTVEGMLGSGQSVLSLNIFRVCFSPEWGLWCTWGDGRGRWVLIPKELGHTCPPSLENQWRPEALHLLLPVVALNVFCTSYIPYSNTAPCLFSFPLPPGELKSTNKSTLCCFSYILINDAYFILAVFIDAFLNRFHIQKG